MPLSGLLKRLAKLGSSTTSPELELPDSDLAADSSSSSSQPAEPSHSVGSPSQPVHRAAASLPASASAGPQFGRQLLLAVDTSSLAKTRERTGSGGSSKSSARTLQPGNNPGLIFTPATPIGGDSASSPQDIGRLKLFGQMKRTSSPIREDSLLLHGDQEQEIAPPASPQLSASPDSYTATEDDLGDLPGIPRSGSPLPMSDNEEESDDEDDEHDLRDEAEAKLEEEEQAKDKQQERKPTSSDTAKKPNAMSAFPSRALLQRLPSQAITDTPSTDSGGARSPAGSFGFPSMSRNPSYRHPSRMASMDRVQNSTRSPGPGRNSPAARVSADYGFPSAGMVADPEAIQEEEDPAQDHTAAASGSGSGSGSGSTYASHITGSPPSSSTSYLDASPHRYTSPKRQASSRQTSTSSQHTTSSATHSVSDHSTPAGFLKHRRNSSQHGREVKETLNATSRELPNGKRKLNQYILTEDIGRGSFGVVQKAKDVDTGTEYAVKEFSKMRLRKRQQSEMIRRQGRGAAMRRPAAPIRKAPQPRTGQGGPAADGKSAAEAEAEADAAAQRDLDLIRSEVAVMKKLDHPNVVKLFEVLDVREDDSLFMVVELCADGPIMSLSMGEEKEAMDEETARNYFRQIILAVEYLHCNGIIHRDIKPENILKMSNDELIKLMDFGVSEIFDKNAVDDPRELKTGGSPAFMAPELCVSNHGKVSGKAADIWAAGVTLYCLVVGRLPFESNLMLELYEQIRNTPVKIPKELSEPLKDLLKRLLEKDPEQRIKMPELREHAWVTIDGRDPLPSTEVNVSSLPEITEADLADAIAVPSVSYIVNAVRAASRWKRFAARRTMSDGHHSTDGSLASTSSDMSRSCSLEGRQANAEQSNLTGAGKSLLDKGITPAPWALAQVAAGAMDGRQANEDIKHAASFPMSATENEKGADYEAVRRRPTKLSSASTTVDFPDITSAQAHHDHLSAGIDDTNIETLRYYEDQTGHMLPRSAIHTPSPSNDSTPGN